MPEAIQTDDLLETLAKVMLRCWIFGFIMLLFWWSAVTLAGDLVLGVHGDMFDLTRSQLIVIHYCGMGSPSSLLSCSSSFPGFRSGWF